MSSTSPAPSRPTPSGAPEPKIRHSFDGDVKVLNSTVDSRMEIRKTLSNLQQLLERLEGRNVQVAADIKLRIGGPDAKEHTYSVTINDPKLELDAFLRQFPSAKKDGIKASSSTSFAGGDVNGQHGSSARRESWNTGDDTDIIEVRPSKKARTDADDGLALTSSSRDMDSLLREAVLMLTQRSPSDTLEFMKQWHTEWVKQGGWLFDTMNKAEKLAQDNQTATHTRLGTVQDVLGQSMNAASASTMTELINISKLVPWLEQCRKSAADKAQAREEKWRTSSAAFHDQSRRDRETAEKRLQDELAKQRALLVKIAEANDVDVEEESKEAGRDEDREEREASLGAQLTAELNMEANRASEKGAVEAEKSREVINIDDDDK